MQTLLFLILQGLLPPPAVRVRYIHKVPASLRRDKAVHSYKAAPRLQPLGLTTRGLTLIIALEVIRKRVARSFTAFTRSLLSEQPRRSSSSLRERWRAAPCFPISSLQVLRSSSLVARVLSTPWVRARSSWGTDPSSPESSAHKDKHKAGVSKRCLCHPVEQITTSIHPSIILFNTTSCWRLWWGKPGGGKEHFPCCCSTPLPLQNCGAVNEHRCLGNAGPCQREAGLFLEEGGKKRWRTALPYPCLYEPSLQSRGFNKEKKMLGCFLSFKMNSILLYGQLGHIKGFKRQVY